jgi:hypothetical protein
MVRVVRRLVLEKLVVMMAAVVRVGVALHWQRASQGSVFATMPARKKVTANVMLRMGMWSV